MPLAKPWNCIGKSCAKHFEAYLELKTMWLIKRLGKMSVEDGQELAKRWFLQNDIVLILHWSSCTIARRKNGLAHAWRFGIAASLSRLAESVRRAFTRVVGDGPDVVSADDAEAGLLDP